MDVREAIAAVAEAHAPEGGYGDTYWDADQRKVFWVAADWSSNDEVTAAEEAFLAIPGVDEFDSDAECDPDGGDYERVWPTAITAAGDGTIPESVHYRDATDPETSCATCLYYQAGLCTRFDAKVSPSKVCDDWAPIEADHVAAHNAIARKAYARVDLLEPRLAALLEPILANAGTIAATAFRRMATDHLTAALTADADITPQSGMVALYPRPDEAAALAEDGGEDPALMHVTLAYLGEVDDDTAARVAASLAKVAGTHPPLEGHVGGVGAFDDNGNGVPAILLPDVPGLVELRQDACNAILTADADYSRSHGYQPHLTVAYRDGTGSRTPDRAAIGSPLHFDHIRVVVGNKIVAEHPLTGAPALTADAAPPPQWSAPAPDEIINVAALVSTLRTKTDPVRLALIKTAMTPLLENAGLSFDVTNPLTARVLAQSGSQITHIAQTTQLNVMRIVKASYDQGLSIPDTATAIRAGMQDASKARATLIARTELAGAANGGSLAATQIVASATGSDYFKQWLTAPGARYPRHEDYDGLDGQTVRLDETFEVGDSQLQFPGDPDGDPGEVCNCFPAETLVEMPGLRASTRRWYDGDLVRLYFATGDSLAATPNHPVLRASDGRWVPMHEIDEGDDLVSARLARYDAGAPHPDRPAAPIGEVHRLAQIARDPERVCLRPPDFHGEGADGEVDVVAVEGSLLLDRDAASDEEVAELGLSLAYAARTCESGGHDALAMADGIGQHFSWAAARGVGPVGKDATIFVAQSLHPEPVGIGARSYGEAELVQPPNDQGSAYAELLTDREDALTALVSLAKVVKVDVESFHGYVYNLDTGAGWYTAATIACRNCRCTLVYTDDASQLTDQSGGVDGGTAAPNAVPAPEAPPPGDTVSVNTGPFVPPEMIRKINDLGIADYPNPDAQALSLMHGFTNTKDMSTVDGAYTDERKAEHQQILDEHFAGKTPSGEKNAYFTAGGSASGKSSAVFDVHGHDYPIKDKKHPELELGNRPDTVHVDPDRIKKMINEFKTLDAAGDPYAASAVHEESSDIAKAVVAEAQKRGLSYVLDTTGSGDTFEGKIAAAKKLGYKTQVSMWSTPTNEAIVRSVDRGDRGGRYVAIRAVKHAHRNASKQLGIWMDSPNVDQWRVWDNADGPKLIARGTAGKPAEVFDPETLAAIRAKATEH